MLQDLRYHQLLSCLLCLLIGSGVGYAQQQRGEVIGTMSGGVYKYHGEFSDDLWGAVGQIGIHYAVLDRLNVEGRVGLGEIRWKVTPSLLAAYPEYFGRAAQLGGRYPGTLTTIESQSESRISTVDLMVNYVLVDNIPAIPFLSAGIGLVNFSPTNAHEHEALPNNAFGRYAKTVFSIPIGAGIRFPLSDLVELTLRGEHRFVFTPYLDDADLRGRNDGLTSATVGVGYRFTPASPRRYGAHRKEIRELEIEIERDLNSGWEHPHRCQPHPPASCSCEPPSRGCCCCCCGSGSGGGQGGGAGSGSGSGSGSGEAGPEPGPAREAFSKDIRFQLDSDAFDFTQPETQKNLDELLAYLQDAPQGHEVIIEGHASADGPPARNQWLSERRAERVRDWLVEQGVRPEMIRGTMGYGSTHPKVAEPTPEEMKTMTPEQIEKIRATNRRIEVRIVHDGYKRKADEERRRWEQQRRSTSPKS